MDGAASTAALTVSVFPVSMALARFGGDRVIQRLGPVVTVRMAGACAAVGALTVVVGIGVVPVLIGFGLLGMGIAYGSGLIAPGIIGGLAHATSLTFSFVLVAALTVGMGLSARALRNR